MANAHDFAFKRLTGEALPLKDFKGKAVLIVNTASECGYTPQYEELERLWQANKDKGLVVLGVPCNQFGAQEPGTSGEIGEFCSVNYGVTFPMFAKIDVNGPDRHPLYAQLTNVADAEGKAGDIQWNFEKFLVGPDGTVLARFRPLTEPEAPEVVSAIESSLAG
jgi:glutathione peroxidase